LKLFYSPGACSLATHIILREGGFDFELDKVDMKSPDRMTQEGKPFREITHKSYVPAVRLDDGEVIQENVVIHSYLADLKPDSKLAPPYGSRERLRQDQMAVYISTEIHKTYSPLFNPALTEEAKNANRDKLIARYALIEEQLGDGRAYLTGDTFRTVDAYLFTITRWGYSLKLDLARFPKVEAWYKRVGARPAVKASLEAEGLAQVA
jgi:glutathione S-transferase